MANAMRPDWPVSSLVTHLSNQHAARTYHELAVALAWICTDPQTKTPARLAENGPWWAATRATTSNDGARQRCPIHKALLQAGDCPKCAEGLTRNRPANFQQIYDRARADAQAFRDHERQQAITEGNQP